MWGSVPTRLPVSFRQGHVVWGVTWKKAPLGLPACFWLRLQPNGAWQHGMSSTGPPAKLALITLGSAAPLQLQLWCFTLSQVELASALR